MSPSGKAPGFGPGISEVRVLPSQPFKPIEQSVGLIFWDEKEGGEPQSESFVKVRA